MYARDDMTTPMRIAVGMVGANVVLNVVLIWWLREAGLAVSTAVCAVGQCAAVLVSAAEHVFAAGIAPVRCSAVRETASLATAQSP